MYNKIPDIRCKIWPYSIQVFLNDLTHCYTKWPLKEKRKISWLLKWSLFSFLKFFCKLPIWGLHSYPRSQHINTLVIMRSNHWLIIGVLCLWPATHKMLVLNMLNNHLIINLYFSSSRSPKRCMMCTWQLISRNDSTKNPVPQSQM